MESPPSTSAWSDAFILSDDSGLLLTSGSISSGSMSGESKSGQGNFRFEYLDSDCDGKSLSQADSLDGMSDIICGENFNTLKKGQNWTDFATYKSNSPIEPPPEFQDKPSFPYIIQHFANNLTTLILQEALNACCEKYIRKCRLMPSVISKTYWSADFLPYSPCHSARPSSRSSLGSSRLSSSHNSLSVPAAHKADDSSFITQAVSHDTLTTNQISDLYNVPFDSDVYAIPVDTVKPPVRPKRNTGYRKRRRNTSSSCKEYDKHQLKIEKFKVDKFYISTDNIGKRHSLAGTSTNDTEPIHMTLQEVRHYLQTLYSSSSDSSEQQRERYSKQMSNIKYSIGNNNMMAKNLPITTECNIPKQNQNNYTISKKKKTKDILEINKMGNNEKNEKRKKLTPRFSTLRQALCNIFRFRKATSPEHKRNNNNDTLTEADDNENKKTYVNRALPPLPEMTECLSDFATSIEKVKDYGWYWGPISSEAAEKILSNEPDGSFLVRDSSDDHYIFSLTFKLNNSVRHVRIDHDQGNFSFGSCQRFKSQTIVEFIENAVEHSRSGRYLFFLHRRPTIGPVRVQLVHPVSRFKHTQSLQHLCRFVILKMVRKDLISNLPLPRRMIDYLNTPHYYTEQLIEINETNNTDNNNSKIDNYNSNEPNNDNNNLTPLLQLTPDGFSNNINNGRTNVPRNISPILRQS